MDGGAPAPILVRAVFPYLDPRESGAPVPAE